MNIEIEDIFYDTNDFQVIPKEIGHGAFGKVYIARHKTTKKDYAIKIINTEESFNSQKQAQFLRESLILRNLHHPSVVKYVGINFQSFQDESKLQPSIITEYLKNGSLKNVLCDERLAQAHFEWNSTKKYITLIGIADAMRYLHKQGIIHRDLKPENILLDENFNPKICDFGLSRCFLQELTKNHELTMTGQFGTVNYMAPEILENNDDTGHYSIAIDVYAFGIIAYEIITGKKPYYELGKINAVSLGIKVLNGHRPTFTKDVSEKMKELITRCLKKNPIERPSFDEIYDKLTNDYEHSIDPINKEEVEIYIETLNDDKNDEIIQSQKMKNDQSLLKLKEDKIKQLEKEKSQLQEKYDKLMQENEQNKKKINDLDFDTICNMVSSRKDAFLFARFYESVNCYNEAFAMLKKMVTYDACLSKDERELLTSTCKEIVRTSRDAIYKINYIINDSTFSDKKQIEFLIQNKKLLSAKIEKFCNEVIDLIDKQIFPAVRDNESIIYCEKTKADYWRYICESNPESKIINKAKQSYEKAIQMAETSFKQVNSTILGLYLNYSVLLFEITGEKQRALDYSQMQYNKYSNAIKDLSDESFQTCSLIMQLISDNISIWKDELKK